MTRRAATPSTPEWERFVAIRDRKGLRMVWIAEQLGTDTSTLTKRLKGVYGYPATDAFVADLARVMGEPIYLEEVPANA